MRRCTATVTRKYPILLSSIAMLVVILACNAPWMRPAISNIRMTTDSSGKTSTSTYAPDTSFFLYADLRNLATNQVVEARWYAVDAEGVELNSEINKSTYDYQPGISEIYFRLDPTGGPWPAGSYRVEMYLDGTKVGEQGFTVR